MAEESSYDMRQKLLDIQNELIKGTVQEQIAQEAVQAKTQALSSPEIEKSHQGTMHADVKKSAYDSADTAEIMSMLKDIKQGQQKMINILININNKLK